MTFPLQWPHPWNYISPLVDANRRALASSRVKSRTVSASFVWAWPMHETLFLAFQIASTARIVCLKPCVLDSWFLTEDLPFFPTALLQRPPSSMKPRPGARRQSSRPWRVSSFHFLSLHCMSVTAQILQSSFLAVILHPAWKYGTPFPSGWRIFYILRPPTLRISGPRYSTFSRLAARRRGLLRPILNSRKF